jgi:hypothetical protein
MSRAGADSNRYEMYTFQSKGTENEIMKGIFYSVVFALVNWKVCSICFLAQYVDNYIL